MRTAVSVDYGKLGAIMDMRAMLHKREIAEQAVARAAFLIRDGERKQTALRGPRNRAERRRLQSLGRC